MIFLVIGGGSIGRRHSANLFRLYPDAKIFISEPNPLNREKTGNALDGDVAWIEEDWSSVANSRLTAAFVCTPSSMHAEQTIKLAGLGVKSIFVEKPLARTKKELASIDTVVRKLKCRVMVGANFRYDGGMFFVKEYLSGNHELGKICSVRAEYGRSLPSWHPWEDYRKGYSARSDLGGGVLFDRIHELDYLCYLFGRISEIRGFMAKNSSLDIDTDDTVEMVLKFESGLLGSVHLDYVAQAYRCRMEIVGDRATLNWNFLSGRVELENQDGTKLLYKRSSENVNDMYLEQTKHFIEFIGSEKSDHFEFYTLYRHVTEKSIEVMETAGNLYLRAES